MATTNMTHQPQEVLIKVMCSERLPERGSKVFFESKHGEISVGIVWRDTNNEIVSELPSGILDYDTIAWYEPATRIVLTEEEYKELESERLAYKDFIEWWFKNKYDATENVGNFIETIRFIQDRLGY